MNRKFLLKFMLSQARKPRLVQKLVIVSIVGLIAITMVSGLVVWAGIAAVGRLSGHVDQVMNSKVDVLTVDRFQSCLNKAQGLLSFQPWIERTVGENLNHLKVACLEPVTQPEKATEEKVI